MVEFALESVIKKGVDEAINTPVYEGKSITEWAAIGMKAPRWINVEDKLPEDARDILIYDTNYGTTMGCYIASDRSWWPRSGTSALRDVTHWMPLPESPKT